LRTRFVHQIIPILMTVVDSAKSSAPGVFNTTHWTLVIDAADTKGEGAAAALEELCETYWYPLYAYVRRFGNGPDEARDLTQGFFEQLLEKKIYKVADRERGKFRTFLLTSLKNFLAKEHQKATRQKRGGSATHFSLDFQDAEGRYVAEPSHEVTAEILFEREWAKALLGRTLAYLRAEYAATGQVERFDVLSSHLVQPEGNESYTDLAEKLGLSLAVIKTSMHRLRARFRDIYRQEIAAMVGGPEEVDDEIRHLFQTLAGS
jgi:DNA-directed RNA polymerase specialized sigma24 family protein